MVMTVRQMAEAFMIQDRPAGNLLDEDIVLQQAVNATRFYAGYGRLQSQMSDLTPAPPVPAVSADLLLSDSEWAVIRPLFLLYVERETALHLEASRGLGLDVFGRSTGEIAQDIRELEGLMPDRAFSQVIKSI